MHKRPRLLLVNYEYPPLGGGAGTATAGLARAFTELGCEVVVLTSRFRGQPAREESNGFTIVRVPVLRRRLDRCNPVEMLTFLVSACFGALRVTRGWRPDMTIAFFGIPSGPVGQSRVGRSAGDGGRISANGSPTYVASSSTGAWMSPEAPFTSQPPWI